MSADTTDIKATGADGLAALEARSTAETFGIPLAVLAELTHRCPLQCPYCSNPVELDRAGSELTTEEWKKVLTELAEIGVLQIHFSGGEPTARKDLVELVQQATDVGLYTNLITSAVLLTKEKLSALADAGLCHDAALSIHKLVSGEDINERQLPEVHITSQKMGIHEWSYDNDISIDQRFKVPHRDKVIALKDIRTEVELGYDVKLALGEAYRCLNCDVQTVFTGQLCIECDACVDICPMDCIT